MEPRYVAVVQQGLPAIEVSQVGLSRDAGPQSLQVALDRGLPLCEGRTLEVSHQLAVQSPGAAF